ncbi:MAG: cell wall-associated NlpC family hydrolase [bacterium]|jgi:cell wall-associated NlpC family hydrolase
MVKKKNTILLILSTVVFLVLGVKYIGLPLKQKPANQDAPLIATDIDEPDTISLQDVLSLEDSIISFGMTYLGTPYSEAGNGEKGFDCSGFVYFVFQHFNIAVPRSSKDFKEVGKDISIEEIRKGDILLFLSPTRNEIGHVGIVSTPNGSDFIHASSGSEYSIIISNLARDGYSKRFAKAIRVLE